MADPELHRITIRGFKSIASVEQLVLRPVNLLIGPNGSGKSNFIEVFSFLREIRAGRLNDYVRKAGGAEQLLHFGSKTTERIHIFVSFRRQVYNYTLNLMPTADDGMFISSEGINSWNKNAVSRPSPEPQKPLRIGREEGSSELESKKVFFHKFRQHLNRWRVYHVHDTSASSPLRKTAKLHDNEFLRPDGSNLPAFLYLLKEKHPDEYRLLQRTIQLVAPFFGDFHLRPDPLNKETIRLAWKHKDSDHFFYASSLSDGTLRFIVLATLFLQPENYRPSVILVDEPELGLHPAAITLLAALVRQVSEQTQVILSTQSSLLLDHFQPEDVLVADRVAGSTQITRLKSKELAEWLEDYSLGQLWEKNEFGGRPGRE